MDDMDIQPAQETIGMEVNDVSDEITSLIERDTAINPYIVMIMMLFIVSLSTSDVSAQDAYDTPDSVLTCQNYVDGTQENLPESGYQQTEDLPIHTFVETENGELELALHFLSTGSFWYEYQFAPVDYYREVGRTLRTSRPLIDLFLNRAFEKVEGASYSGVDEDQVFVTVAQGDMFPIFIMLAQSMPEEAAVYALEETIAFINSDPEYADLGLHESVKDRVVDLEKALAEFQNYDSPRTHKANGVDYLSLTEVEQKQSIDEGNWKKVQLDLGMPDEIWSFLEDLGYFVHVVPEIELDGFIGKVQGTNIYLGFREDGTMDTEMISHEIWHVLRGLLKDELKPYVAFTLEDGTSTDEVDLALASNLKFFFENETDKYPMFFDIMSYVLHRGYIRNDDIRNYISRMGSGYVGLQVDDPLRIRDVNATLGDTKIVNGMEINVTNEIGAMVVQHVWSLCASGNSEIVPPYISDLFDYEYIIKAIDGYKSDKLEG